VSELMAEYGDSGNVAFTPPETTVALCRKTPKGEQFLRSPALPRQTREERDDDTCHE
jgi:hypothetical protein